MGRYALTLILCLSASILLLVGCSAPEAGNEQAQKADSPSAKETPKASGDPATQKKDAGEKAVAEAKKPSDEAKKEAEKADKVKKETAAKKDDEKKLEKKMDVAEQREVAAKEPKPVVAQASASASASAPASEPASASESASASASAPASESATASESASASASASETAPADTTMYLTVPKMGIYDVPVVEGTTEASLDEGAGHVVGTGYPWVSGSNTYIAGHRIGYPGTPSDMVFWDLPNLVAGDEVLLTDSNGKTYTYAVSEILEVAPTELGVMEPVGRDVVSLQTCIEDFGDYWTAGPNWFGRYVVRADKVA